MRKLLLILAVALSSLLPAHAAAIRVFDVSIDPDGLLAPATVEVQLSVMTGTVTGTVFGKTLTATQPVVEVFNALPDPLNFRVWLSGDVDVNWDETDWNSLFIAVTGTDGVRAFTGIDLVRDLAPESFDPAITIVEAQVPEPATFGFVAAGLLAAFALKRR